MHQAHIYHKQYLKMELGNMSQVLSFHYCLQCPFLFLVLLLHLENFHIYNQLSHLVFFQMQLLERLHLRKFLLKFYLHLLVKFHQIQLLLGAYFFLQKPYLLSEPKVLLCDRNHNMRLFRFVNLHSYNFLAQDQILLCIFPLHQVLV